MPVEIEHKYLVDYDKWKKVTPDLSVSIKQGYLLAEPDKTIRVRIAGDRAFLTIKGITMRASRPEYEFPIPLDDAMEIMGMCDIFIVKTRHTLMVDGKCWEIDEFDGLNLGLWLAEIELVSGDETYIRPDWVGEEVTGNPKYSNSSLAKHPCSTW